MTIRQVLTFRNLVILGAAIAALLAFNRGLAPQAAATSPLPGPRPATLEVETEPVSWAKSYQRSRVYTGQITARRTAELGFERLGKLVSIQVDDGERVEQGAVLAELDQRELSIQRGETRALRRQAAARLAELVAGPRKQTIAAARGVVDDLAAQLELNHRKLRRAEKLRARGTIGQEALEEVQFLALALDARLSAARERLEELVEGTRKERITAQEAVVAQLDARLATIDLRLEKSVLRAPFSGRIGARLVDEGRVVTAREPVLRLVESDVLEARVGLPARVAARLRPGEKRRVRVDGREWPAFVRSILPGVDAASRTRTVVLDLEHPGDAVVPGQIARLEVREFVEARGLWLPNTALVKSTRGLWSVYVVHEGRIEKREVELIHTQSDRVLVRGTLRTGESVVVTGTHRVVPGQQVEG